MKHRRFWGVAASLGMAAVLSIWQSSAKASGLDQAQAGRELIALTNLNRTVNGLQALLVDGSLNEVARARSEDMIARQYFSHYIPPDNHTVINIMQTQQFDFQLAGENIAWNTATDFASVQYANTQFMNSEGHRVNILDTRFNTVGAGVASDATRRMHSVVFMTGTAFQPLPDEVTAPRDASISPLFPLPDTLLSSTAPVTIQWRSGQLGILYYQVQISPDPTFNTDPLTATSFVWDNTVHGPLSTPPNSYTTPELPRSAVLYWRIRPRVDIALLPVSWSATWSFRTP